MRGLSTLEVELYHAFTVTQNIAWDVDITNYTEGDHRYTPLTNLARDGSVIAEPPHPLTGYDPGWDAFAHHRLALDPPSHDPATLTTTLGRIAQRLQPDGFQPAKAYKVHNDHPSPSRRLEFPYLWYDIKDANRLVKATLYPDMQIAGRELGRGRPIEKKPEHPVN